VPSTGYDLSKIMDRTTNFFWQATHAQIHQRLKALRKAGYVYEEPVWEKGRQARIIYHLTSTGGKALKEWVQGPAQNMAVRHGFLSQFQSSYLLDAEEIMRKLEVHQEESRKSEDVYKKSAEILEKRDMSDKKNQIDYLIALYGANFEKAIQQWCEEASRFLVVNQKSLDPQEGKAPRDIERGGK
jgi:PadR family transcriptional regulator AphA